MRTRMNHRAVIITSAAATMLAVAQTAAFAAVVTRQADSTRTPQVVSSTARSQATDDNNSTTPSGKPLETSKPKPSESDDAKKGPSEDPSRSACPRKDDSKKKACAAQPLANSETVMAIIPPVIFQSGIQVKDGQLTSAVLVAAGEPVGKAQIFGTRCAEQAVPGKATWLNCKALKGQETYTVTVTLSDGRSFSRPLPAVKLAD